MIANFSDDKEIKEECEILDGNEDFIAVNMNTNKDIKNKWIKMILLSVEITPN